MKNIILIGFMGSGKTSVGNYIADGYAYKQIDTDAYIENKYGMKISDIFAGQGEAAFRQMETDTLKELLHIGDNCLISVGGGLPVKPENRKLLHELGYIVYLKAEVDTLVKRLEGDTERPLLQGTDLRTRVTSLMDARKDIYEELADLIVNTDEKNLGEIAKEIMEGIQ